MNVLLDPLNLVPNLLSTAFAVWVAWFALTRGGPVERFMGAFNGANWMGWWALALANVALFGNPQPPWMISWLWDLSEAGAFLWLAIRHNNRWMALGAAAQGLQMGARASGLIVGEMNTVFAYFIGSTIYLMSFVMGAVIVGSTISHARKMRRQTSETPRGKVRPPLFRLGGVARTP